MLPAFTFSSLGPVYFGLKEVRQDAVLFKLRDYLDLNAISIPRSFGFVDNATEWLMLGNNRAGCCVVSGACHEHMIFTHASRQPVAVFTDDIALIEYKIASGWNGVQNDPTDTGLDMEEYAKRRRTVGIHDDAHRLHKIVAYADIGKSFDAIAKAIYIFGAVGLGIRVPDSALVQFEAQHPWTVVSGSNVVGRHYLPAVGLNSSHDLVGITWARLQAMDSIFVETFVDAAIAYITEDFLMTATQRTPRHFDRANLDADLAALAT